MRLIVKWLVCCGALFVADVLFPADRVFFESPLVILGAGTVLWLLNIFIRPVAQIVSLPLTLLTLGIFSLVVNALIVALADTLIPGMSLASFWLCLFVALVISAGNLVLVPRSGRRA